MTRPPSEPSGSADELLQMLAARTSCRMFDGSSIDPETLKAIVRDGTEAPSSCNQQQWHFIVVTDRERLEEARAISGGNPHFSQCSALIFICFQKGWTHNNYSVMQSVAAATYHMILSAHLRGLASIWNGGIGDTEALREMLQLPQTFDVIGALAIGRAAETAPRLKAPRRPVEAVMSMETFSRPAEMVYPAKPAPAYPAKRITNTDNPFAEWDPSKWSWAQIGDFRGYTVWAKSPIAGVFVSRRNAEAGERELDLLPKLSPGARVAEIMPWGGTSTVCLKKRLPAGVFLDIAELSDGNIRFIEERLRREGLWDDETRLVRFAEGRLPHEDASLDAVVLSQTLEHVPDRKGVLAEMRRVLRPGGALLVSARNMTSRYGLQWRRHESKGQVPLQGPFTPIAVRKLREEIGEGFDIGEEIGIGLEAGYDAAVKTGCAAYRCRLYAIRAVPKP